MNTNRFFFALLFVAALTASQINEPYLAGIALMVGCLHLSRFLERVRANMGIKSK